MRRPNAPLTTLVASCFLVGCMGIQATAIPEPTARNDVEVHGVVLAGRRAEEGERIEARRVEDVRWTDSTLVIIGVFEDGAPDGERVETRTFALESLSAILVRSVDVNKTSAIIALAVVGTIVAVALVINGQGGTGPLR